MPDKEHEEVVKMAQKACSKGIACDKCAFDYLCDIQSTCEMLYDAGCRLPDEESREEGECCYTCKHFSAHNQPRIFTDGFSVFGTCFVSFTSAIPTIHPVYIPNGKCKKYTPKGEEQI